MTSPAPTSERGYASSPAGNGSGWWGSLDDNEQVPELQWPVSLVVYDRMRKDAQVMSALEAVKLPIQRTSWRLDPNGSRPEVFGGLAEDLGLPVVGQGPQPRGRTRGRFSFSEHLELAMLQFDFGASAFEQVARIDESAIGTGRPAVRLRKLAPRLPRTIAKWNVARDGGLESIQQHGTDAPIPVSRLVVYSHKREGGAWWGQSILRPAYKAWYLKDPTLRVWVQSIDRNGMGVPIGVDGPNATPEDSKALLDVATNLRSGSNSGARLPHGAELRLAGVEGTLVAPEPAVRYFDEQIARSVLAHFLNLGTQTGSWALGSTFAEFFVQSLQAKAEKIADVLTAHVVEDWVDWNFGPDEPAPRIVFDEIGSKSAATAQALKMLVDAGIVFPDRVLEEAVRQSHGLPAKDSPAPVPA